MISSWNWCPRPPPPVARTAVATRATSTVAPPGRVTDQPLAGRPLPRHLQVRRFVCRAPTCPRRTVAEQPPALVARYARRSTPRRGQTDGCLLVDLETHEPVDVLPEKSAAVAAWLAAHAGVAVSCRDRCPVVADGAARVPRRSAGGRSVPRGPWHGMCEQSQRTMPGLHAEARHPALHDECWPGRQGEAYSGRERPDLR
jgi:hypothetical protein